MKRISNRGFTLIELMVTVAIVAILASIVYPSYTSSVLKGKRAQAKTALAELLQQQERFMTQKNCYLSFDTDTSGAAVVGVDATCGITAATPIPFKTFSGDNLKNSAYVLMAGACPTSTTSTTPVMSMQDCVRVIAVPIGQDPAVGAIRMTSTGTKDCTAPGGSYGALAMSSSKLCWP